LAAHFLHEILARHVAELLLDDGGMEGEPGAQFLHDLGGGIDRQGRHIPTKRKRLDHVPHTGVRGADDERLALENGVHDERLGRQRFL
jgi:hypothetical protein